MNILLNPNILDRCCLCGSSERLTGEHKVKATTIRSIFSGKPMMIGSFDGVEEPRLAQSSKSKAFHFTARVCAICNSTRSQPADVKFARFDELARTYIAKGAVPRFVFADPRYAVGTEPYLNVFRYLAKVLACQIAEVGGPRIAPLTNFAINRTNANPVSLSLGEDPKYRQWFDGSGDPEFAGHGGLGAYFSRRTALVNGLTSTLTHGPLQYSFSIGFGWPIGLALRLLYPEFHEKCAKAYRLTIAKSERRKD